MSNQITVLPFDEADFNTAHWIAFRMGMDGKYAYTSGSDLGPGFYFWPQTPADKRGAIVKTKEFGWMYVADLRDLGLHDIADKVGGASE